MSKLTFSVIVIVVVIVVLGMRWSQEFISDQEKMKLDGVELRYVDYESIKTNFPDQNFMVCNLENKKCAFFYGLEDGND